MSKTRQIAVATLGKKNTTRISSVKDYSPTAIETFRRQVAKKNPDKIYYLVEVDEATGGSRRKEPFMVWHVGEGFEHHEGWWVLIDD